MSNSILYDDSLLTTERTKPTERWKIYFKTLLFSVF